MHSGRSKWDIFFSFNLETGFAFFSEISCFFVIVEEICTKILNKNKTNKIKKQGCANVLTSPANQREENTARQSNTKILYLATWWRSGYFPYRRACEVRAERDFIVCSRLRIIDAQPPRGNPGHQDELQARGGRRTHFLTVCVFVCGCAWLGLHSLHTCVRVC